MYLYLKTFQADAVGLNDMQLSVTARPSVLYSMMAYKIMTVIMVMTVQFWSSLSVTGSSLTRYYSVMVSNATLVQSKTLKTLPIPPGASHTLRCSNGCSLLPWCNLWYRNPSTDLCFLSDIIVMPTYVENSMVDDALTCYTRRHRDFATGALIYGLPDVDVKFKENLVDGIYFQKKVHECHMMQVVEGNPWFMLDLREPVTFRIVKLIVQPGGSSGVLLKTKNLEVRIGTSIVDTLGNFEAFKVFGKFIGPATYNRQEIVLGGSKPVTARYISVQKTIQEKFQLCHVEVY